MLKRRARSSGRPTNRSLRNSRIARCEQLEPRLLLTSLPYGAVAQDTGEYMLGDVVATVVFFESDGSIDANLENWTPELTEATKDRIVEGLEWWEDSLANFYETNYVDVAQVH